MNIYPVVHVKTPKQALKQAEIVIEAGADGVYLIDHGSYPTPSSKNPLIDSFNALKAEHPQFFVGLNYLLFSPCEGYLFTSQLLEEGKLQTTPDALWFDDALGCSVHDKYEGVREVAQIRNRLGLEGVKLLGGLSFKYTDHYSDDPLVSAELVKIYGQHIDEVVTSGSATGTPPSIEKVRAMKEALDSGRIAVASGVSIENIGDYRGVIDDVLVASSLETHKYSGVFVPEKVHAFFEAAHSGEK